MKVLSFLLLIALSLSAAPLNFSNWTDESTITGFKADSLKYGNVAAVTGSVLNALVAMANDTSSAGYASDSINFTYGYRLGTIVLNSSNKPDTAWGHRVIVGTFATDTSKIINATRTTTTDSLTGAELPVPGRYDTSNVTGYAVASSPLSTFTAQLIQPWAKGGTGNKIGAYVKLKLLLLQYLYVPTRVQ